MSDGWIKLHRKILENPVVCKDADYLAVWIYLLLKATHDEIQMIFRGEKIRLRPGQLITGDVYKRQPKRNLQRKTHHFPGN